MDSLSQFVLGAAVAIAVSPVKTRKIALLGGAIATLPDLDVFLNYGDELTTLIHHRSFSHSLFVLFPFAFVLAFALQHWLKTWQLNYQNWLTISLAALITHPLLDAFTIFGTQLFWPLDVPSVMIGSMFIIDPIYTVPLLLSFVILLLKNRMPRVFKISLNTLTLAFSTGYLVLSLILQAHVSTQQTYPADVRPEHAKIITPTPFNLLIWRTVIKTPDEFVSSFYHLLNGNTDWQRTKHHQKMLAPNADLIQKYAIFSHGFYRLSTDNNQLNLSDVRMGSVNSPVFRFQLGRKIGEDWQAIRPKKTVTNTLDLREMFGGHRLF